MGWGGHCFNPGVDRAFLNSQLPLCLQINVGWPRRTLQVRKCPILGGRGLHMSSKGIYVFMDGAGQV